MIQAILRQNLYVCDCSS